MEISCSTCQKKEHNAYGLNICFTLFCCDFKFVVIYDFFPPPNLYSKNFRVHNTRFFFQVCPPPPSPQKVSFLLMFFVTIINKSFKCMVFKSGGSFIQYRYMASLDRCEVTVGRNTSVSNILTKLVFLSIRQINLVSSTQPSGVLAALCSLVSFWLF